MAVFARGIAIVAIAVGTAQADDPQREAAEKMERGLRRYNTQDYDGAIAEWREAYVLVPSPDTLFAIGQAQRLKGDCKAALLTYRAVTQTVVTSTQTEEVKKVIAICEQELKDHPEPAPKPVEPIALPKPASSPTETRTIHTAWYADPASVSLLAGGAIFTITGGTFLFLARSAESDAESAKSYEDFSDAMDRKSRNRTIGTVTGAIGGALLVGGLIRILTRNDTVEVRVPVAVNSASIEIAGHF